MNPTPRMTKREFLRLQAYSYAKRNAPTSFNQAYQGRSLIKGRAKGVGFKQDKRPRELLHQCRIER